jgi:hypothetical protein
MIALGLSKTLDAHTVVVTWNATPHNAVMGADTYDSPLAYLEAVLTEAGATTWTYTLTAHTTYTLEDVDGYTVGDATWDPGDVDAAEYAGADTLVLTLGAESEPIDELWAGEIKRRPGLLGKMESDTIATRKGLHQAVGQLQEDTLSVWTSETAWSELEDWYAWVLLALASEDPVEYRDEDNDTSLWYIGQTDVVVESVEGEGVLTSCALPVIREVTDA